MRETKPRWFEVTVDGTVRVGEANLALLESTSRQLGLVGLRVNEAPRDVVMGYRDAPRGSRSLTQSRDPVRERVRELRVSVEDGGTLRYVAHVTPDVFEPLLLTCGAAIFFLFVAWPRDRVSLVALGVLAVSAVVSVALGYVRIVRAHRKLRAQVEGAVDRALAERAG